MVSPPLATGLDYERDEFFQENGGGNRNANRKSQMGSLWFKIYKKYEFLINYIWRPSAAVSNSIAINLSRYFHIEIRLTETMKSSF